LVGLDGQERFAVADHGTLGDVNLLNRAALRRKNFGCAFGGGEKPNGGFFARVLGEAQERDDHRHGRDQEPNQELC